MDVIRKLIYHNIFRFKIPMHNPQRVQVPHTDDYLLYNGCGFHLLQMVRLLNQFEQVLTWTQLGDYVHVCLGLEATLELYQ